MHGIPNSLCLRWKSCCSSHSAYYKGLRVAIRSFCLAQISIRVLNKVTITLAITVTNYFCPQAFFDRKVVLCVYAPFLKTSCHVLKCNINFWLTFHSEIAEGKVRHSWAFEFCNFQKKLRNLRFQRSANSDLAIFKKAFDFGSWFPQNKFHCSEI